MTLPFLEKLLQVLAQGGFTSTYKYAVLLGLIDLCVEAGQPPTSVTTTQLARRVVELYWPQVRPFDGKPLLNSAGKQAGIVSLIAAYIEDHGDIVSPGMAVLCDATGFADLLREVEWILIEYPLPRVQRVGPHHDAFIYEVNWDTTVSRSRFLRGKQRRSDFDNAIRFVDGAALELVRLAPVLVPLLRAEWTAKVSALNALAEARLAEHLFGRDRIDHSPCIALSVRCKTDVVSTATVPFPAGPARWTTSSRGPATPTTGSTTSCSPTTGATERSCTSLPTSASGTAGMPGAWSNRGSSTKSPARCAGRETGRARGASSPACTRPFPTACGCGPAKATYDAWP